MMFKYFPANKDVKQMSANGIIVTQEGYSSNILLPELESLVQAKILKREESNLEDLKKKAEKEAKEALLAQEEADKLLKLTQEAQKKAQEAQDLANKEELEAKEAQEAIEISEDKPQDDNRKNKFRKK